jgi:hypothetical protein
MKKVLLLIMSVIMLTACSSDDDGAGVKNNAPSTQVFVMGQEVKANAAAPVSVLATYAPAYYFIRVDNRIPNMGACKPNYYWPRTVRGGSVFAEGNKGTVNTTYPYWKFFGQDGITKYVYDTTGKAVQATLGDVPSYASLMSANQDWSLDVDEIDTKDLHIIWYVSKFESGVWHVDGVLTFKSVDNITDVPGINKDNKFEDSVETPSLPNDGKGNIEVDIHQQEHKTWQEIKTTVHVRDLVDNVVVEIPLEYENIAESDDFAIRTYDVELESRIYINGTEYALDSTNPVKVTIEHRADKAVFTIVCKDAKYLAALRKEFEDGVTVEIHTYPKNLTPEVVWGKLKNSTVKVSPASYEHLIFKGATSALFTE